MMYRILHFADLHLDASFASAGMTPSVARQRRGDLRTALKRLINKAKELGVSAITIGGDLYEYERVSSDTINFLKAQFESIAPILVIIAPGNHDPYLPGSPYRQIEWSSNVFIFSTPELSPHEISSEITLWGAAHDSPSFRVNLFERFKVPRSGIQIILLHASDITRVPAGKDAHCPFTPKQIAQSGAKFSLFGHYHRALLEPALKPLYSYPGSPEPLGFDEEGTHYALLAEVVDEHVSAELIPVNAVEYRKMDIDISNALSVEDVKQAIRVKSIEGKLSNSFVRVLLKGDLHPDVEIDIEAIVRDCHELFRFLDVEDYSCPAYDLDDIKQEATVRGAFVRKMVDRLSICEVEEDKRIVQQSIIYGLRALDGREI